jgi:hypothetical protein
VSIEIHVGPPSQPPFEPAALAVEDDTYQVLGAESTARESYENVRRLMERAAQVEPERPGSVQARPGDPLRIHAIVHDLDREPTWREDWIVDALAAALGEADRRRLDSLALPMLGTLHGSLAPRRFVQLLRSALDATRCDHLRRLWLVVPAGTPAALFDPLREYSLRLNV